VTRLEERIGTYEDSERVHEERASELANLLETLKRFDVDVGSVCQLAAEALKNLTDRGNLFEESMKNLRHLAWTVKDRKDEPQLVLLREQNSVLREVVKKLKRKFQILEQTHNEIPKSEDEKRRAHVFPENETISRNNNGNLLNRSTFNENTVLVEKNSLNPSIRENNYHNDTKNCKEHDVTPVIIGGNKNENSNQNENRNKFDIDSSIIDMRGKVMCLESHSNGVVYEEYVFKLATNREIKIKYPVSLKNIETMVKLEFVDSETDYENTPSDRMLILFKDIYAVVNVKQTGIPCSTQTMKMRTSNNFTQTTFTGINKFSRLNAGITVSKEISKSFTLNYEFKNLIIY
ncbi:PREDICTED: uncharacterized protein DDB_G0283697-like, partial [Eufriesea mexicana]|uniref:uncharacterized protein DDB_G0283697-like n=1 Tax=Eufriesea mexicana TaxID=516756 RepID=UPI00083BD206